MVVFNGWLSGHCGVYLSTVIIHVVGLALITLLMIFKHGNPFLKMQKWYLYIGGAIGVLTIVFNNLAFGSISVSAILALGLFGQSITSLIIDQYGLMGMPRYPFSKRKIIGLVILACGIISMLDKFKIMALILSLLSGVTVVLSRTVSAKLASYTNVITSTFYNYLVGLAVSLAAFFLLGGNENASIYLPKLSNAYIYFGGVLGVYVVLLSNIVVEKISSYYLTLLLFMGQVFSGVLIDSLISGGFSTQNLVGGLFAATGLYTNLLLDRKAKSI
jgi:transporter family-2 protein